MLPGRNAFQAGKAPHPKSWKQEIVVLISAALLAIPGCVQKTVRPSGAPTSANDNSYLDLKPGGRLRIVIPIVKSGGYRVATNCVQGDGRTIVCSAPNLTGYEVVYYLIAGRADGNVRLNFVSGEKTQNGKTVQETGPPVLPFPFPPQMQHIRLIYLVRNSEADHNMAIVASKNANALDIFTKRLKNSPDVCKRDAAIFCYWIPAGIAVIRE